jgi:hypothetical protein
MRKTEANQESKPASNAETVENKTPGNYKFLC